MTSLSFLGTVATFHRWGGQKQNRLLQISVRFGVPKDYSVRFTFGWVIQEITRMCFFVKTQCTGILAIWHLWFHQHLTKVAGCLSLQDINNESSKTTTQTRAKHYKNEQSSHTTSATSASFIMTTARHEWSQIIVQKSTTVSGKGACVRMNASRCL